MRSSDEPGADEAATSPALDTALSLAAVGATVLVYYVLVRWVAPREATAAELEAASRPFLPAVRGVVRPEPQERLLYQLGLLVVTAIPISAYVALRRLALTHRLQLVTRHLAGSKSAIAQSVAILAGASAWLVAVSRNSDVPDAVKHLIGAAAAALLVAALARVSIPRWNVLRYVLLAGFGAVAFLAARCTEPMLLADRITAHHLDVLLGAINQVSHGRTILVDTSSQYGLAYPYVIAALVRPFGLSATSVAIAFTLLALVSLGLLYAVIRRAAGSRDHTPRAELVFLGVVGCTLSYFVAAIFKEPNWIYYQYFPLRVVWGCFFIWYVGVFARARAEIVRRRRLTVLGYALAGFAFLWNTDTGVVIAGAWTATVVFDTLAREQTRWPRFVSTCALHGGALVLTLALSLGVYGVAAWLRSGHLPHFGRLFRFQRVFYGSGFYMLPMKGWELWQPLVAIEGVALFACLRQWRARCADALSTEKIFIAIFGLGIFSYYQGRSHILCLLPVSYPAVLLGGLFFLDFMRAAPASRSAARVRRVVIGLALLAPGWGLATVARTLPKLHADLTRSSPAPSPANAGLVASLDELRRRHAGSELPIVSEMANYMHLETGTWSPFPTSSLAEIFTLEQADELQAELRAKHISKFIVHPVEPPVSSTLEGEKLSPEQWLHDLDATGR